MNRSKQLASPLALALSFTTLLGASAFADNRPSRETRGRDRVRAHDRRSDDRSFDRGRTEARSFDRGRSNNDRSFDRSQRDARSLDASRNNNRNFDRGRGNDRNNNRNNDRSFDRGRSRSSESFRNNDYRGGSQRYRSNDYRGNRQPYFAHGRVSRYERFGGGYRVWLGGMAYPFFIPEARFRLFPRFAVGIDIRLGGYYNPRGYYDYYDGSSYTSGDVRGVVESVDLRRGRLIVHDDVSNAFVTVEMRDYERRLDDVRLGDYIELSGDWTRTGVFIAYRLDSLDPQGGFYR
ncbi:MAG: hypothetical protein AABO58_19045 [Acidobacteriota bacterium]